MIEYRSNAPALAMAFMKVQEINTVFSPEDALRNGTLFPELFKPFRRYREGGMNRD